jgi:hypothetical protein
MTRSLDAKRRHRHDDIDSQLHEFRGQDLQSFVPPVGEPPIDGKIPLLREPELTHALQELLLNARHSGTGGKESDARNFLPRLGEGRERRHQQPAGQRGVECAPIHHRLTLHTLKGCAR